ncbi:hypothetical protein ACOTJD_13925 [Achromobacter xylosoxidans]
MTYQEKPKATPSSNNEPRITSDVSSMEAQALRNERQTIASPLRATPSPYRPAIYRPLRYSLAMQFAAARAAAAQPRLLAVTSNVITWREVIFSTRGIT